MKKRKSNSAMEKAGLLAVEVACNSLDLIWRDILQEDVGVDGTIEVALGEFPTGKLVGAQVKSGTSYIRSESATHFRFYPDADDLAYWQGLSIPFFLLVHDPRDGTVYWVDIAKHIQSQSTDPAAPSSILFSKDDRLDRRFKEHLHARFDLLIYDEAQYRIVHRELKDIIFETGAGDARVAISASSLFIEGLWGLCSKVKFHSSLLSDYIRKAVRERDADLSVTYAFDRATLYPFFTRYFNVLTKHHLATLDATDINHSLYAKMEYPTFIAPLTVNGRKFVEYLRTVVPDVHDNQFLSLELVPHVQIEVYDSFSEEGGVPRFGSYTDLVCIWFNRDLDYYRLLHLRREAASGQAVKMADQTIFHHELREYIDHRFGEIHKDNILLRYFDLPLSPLICWLEGWYGSLNRFPASELRGKSASELAGFADEMASIIGPIGVMTITEPPAPPMPRLPLFNGEMPVMPSIRSAEHHERCNT